MQGPIDPTLTDGRASEARFGLLVQNISDIITVLAADGMIKYESPSTLRVLGFAPEELVGHNAFEFVHPDDVSAVQAAFQRAVRNPGLTVSPEFRFRHANGSWVYLEAIGNNLLHVPEVNGLVVTSRDVTARRALEQQLRQAQKMEAIGQLAGGIAHDFNNMLMIMRGNCELLLNHIEPGNLARGNAERLLHTTDRAARLTQRLLTFSRDRVYSPRVTNLDVLARESVNMYRQLLGSAIELSILPSPEPVWVKADPTLLEQIIMNLAVNARDAMPDGGKLIVKTSGTEIDESCAREGPCIPPGRYAILSITDTGIGMDAFTQEHMFDPFFTTKQKGTGLGLSIVYSITKQSGGQIRVSSALGTGSTFEIYLPAVEHVATTGPSEVHETLQQGTATGAGTLLLAEDEDEIRLVIQEFLKRKGYAVLAAADGLEALELAERHGYRIDALLTDVIMPRMSGPELACRLTLQGPDIRVIFMTGHACDSEVAHGELIQGGMLLQKPFELSALLRLLNEVLAAPATSAS